MEKVSIRVLLIENNEQDVQRIRKILSEIAHTDFEMESAKLLSDGLNVLSANNFDIILFDLSLPDSQGVPDLSKIQSVAEGAPIVVLSDTDDPGAESESVSRGAQDYLVKSRVNPRALSRIVNHAIERQRVRTALEKAIVELRELNQLKTDFISSVSHELHTPLTSISEGANLILEGALGPTTADQREFLGTINQSATRLSNLIEKTLLATQLMTGKLGYNFAAVDVCPIIKGIAQNAKVSVDQKGVLFELAGTSHAVHAYGDEKLLRYAFTQPIENAIQATPKGGLITVRVAAVGGEVEFQVSDTGNGIPAKNLGRIFEQFCFTGTIDDRKTGGLGLGLFTCKGIVEGHRGNIKLESQPGQGTKITIRLPGTPPSAK